MNFLLINGCGTRENNIHGHSFFWSGACEFTKSVMLSESKYLVDFLVEFLGKKPQTLLIPIYVVLPYYMIYACANNAGFCWDGHIIKIILWSLHAEGANTQKYHITMALLLKEEDGQNDEDERNSKSQRKNTCWNS